MTTNIPFQSLAYNRFNNPQKGSKSLNEEKIQTIAKMHMRFFYFHWFPLAQLGRLLLAKWSVSSLKLDTFSEENLTCSAFEFEVASVWWLTTFTAQFVTNHRQIILHVFYTSIICKQKTVVVCVHYVYRSHYGPWQLYKICKIIAVEFHRVGFRWGTFYYLNLDSDLPSLKNVRCR